ncbi:MAG: aminotransferase class I/II-fold pyridoxal phosphate-dependent enzyme [Acidobacteriota bacterium]
MKKNSNRIKERIRDYKDAQRVIDTGLYPYFRPIESEQDTEVIIGGKRLLMFGSNSYMGLTNHPKVKEAAAKAIQKYGTGCAGSRFLNGTLDIHIQCEEKLARFVGKEAALLFSTGFQVNLGVISSVVGRDDYVLLDKLDHASIVDGARLSFGKTIRFRHNDMAGLEEALQLLPHDKGKLIVADGVFSMDGDIFDLPAAARLAEEYNAMIMLDDAHAIGVLGKQGRGTASHFGLTDKVDLIMGTFSKSLAALGGFVASDRVTVEYLKHTSRALIFSASPTPPSVASVMAALDIIESEPERIQKLWDNTHRMADGLKSMGYDLGKSVTPILPVFIGDDLKCFQMCRGLQDAGVFVNPVVSPATEIGNALLRVSLMATHSFEQIDKALDRFEKVGKKLGIRA